MATAPLVMRVRLHRVLRAPAVIADFARRITRPHRVAVTNLASIPLTAFGLGCIDTGVFYASATAGWIVTGLSLIFLEHLIADE